MGDRGLAATILADFFADGGSRNKDKRPLVIEFSRWEIGG